MTSRAASGALLVLLAGLAGCATKGAVRRVETEVVVLRTLMARQDSARAADLAEVIALQGEIMDSLGTAREAVRQYRAETGRDLLNVQASLVQIQELTGQSQRRLAELRRELDDRTQQFAADTAAVPDSLAPPAPAPTPDQLYQASLRELRRGSLGTARAGFQEFLRTYPTHVEAPQVLYYVGETFVVQAPDSAEAYYRQVLSRFPQADVAPTALYKLGLLAERRGDRTGARALFERVIREYPQSDEADLARDKIANLRP